MEAERLDRALREVEAREREERLALLLRSGEPLDSSPGDGGSGVARLRRDVERLTAFQVAVSNSRAWRLIQALRRLVGRAW